MKSERWKQLDKILGLALEVPRENRTAFIKDACGDDKALLAEAMEIMEADDEASKFLSEGVDEGQKGLSRAGELIGAYRLLEVIGEGGMGTVYRAERADGAFEKQVALKLMKPGVVSPLWRRRFRTERHILGRLEHPRIATLLDGGETESEEPYLVMELVEGRPLDRYCREENLSVKDRIVLIEKICETVAFAHQNLIVHRDLKPGNVMVTDQGEPRLLDFGIAKLLEPDLLEVTVEATETHLRPMSPSYASPEQITGGAITTATDVWTLGVLSYEILTGERPYKSSPSLVDMEASRQTAPELPSGVVREKRVRRQLKGDLDTIVLKALRREPERRYGTAADLAADFRRHLNGLPVHARPDSMGYRVGKFVGRHRLPVSLGILSLGVIFSLMIGLFRQAHNLLEERDKARQTVELLVEVLGEASAQQNPGEEVTVREAMELGEPVMRDKLKDQPELLGIILGTIGQVYSEMSFYSEAEERLEEAARLLGSKNSRELGLVLEQLAMVEIYQPDFDGAKLHLEKALSISVAIDPKSLQTVSILNSLGIVLDETNKEKEALVYFNRALDILDSMGIPSSSREQSDYFGNKFQIQSRLGSCYLALGAMDEAQTHYEGCIRTAEQAFSEESAERALAYNEVGYFYFKIGENAMAVEFTQKALSGMEEVLRPGHMITEIVRVSLGKYSRTIGDLEAAAIHCSQGQSSLSAVLGADHPDVGWATAELLATLGEMERWVEALGLLASPEGEGLFKGGGKNQGWYAFYKVKTHLALGDIPAAEEALERVESTESQHAQRNALVLASKADLAEAKGETHKVESLREKAKELWPKVPI